ncbi:MAG: sodium:proton exchanger [Candidatus Rokuibacteriota bacterium]|nr:MAG: sodium:proton exchanger [Candidatus Rokubacteria bacterium]
MRVAAVTATTGNVVALALVVVAGMPAVLIRAGILLVPVEVGTLAFGLGIVSAAFAMSWGAEAAERDVPRALAVIVVALLAVLPEYAVDIVLAWKAGANPAFAPYAAANMTGSNRLLLGIGWPTVALLTWWVRGVRLIELDRGNVPGLLFLTAATVYSFVLPLKAGISLLDSLILVSLFTAYAVGAARSDAVEPDLMGPAALIGALPAPLRRGAVGALFVFAAGVVILSAAPFTEGLVTAGRRLGIDEFLLVQWLAPLASEAPEFLVAALLAVRGKPGAALAVLLSSKINQWTLLVGSLPIAYSIGAGHIASLPLDERQVAEVLLTAAQSLLGVGVLASMSLSLWESAVLAGLFVGQLALGGMLHTRWRDSGWAGTELFAFASVYVLLALGAFLRAGVVLVRLVGALKWR